MRARALLVVLALTAATALGARCSPGLRTIRVDAPEPGALFDDPAPAVAMAARVGTNFDLATVEVRLDGVDLIGALGLTPPFTGAGGVVAIGGAPVAISAFDFTATNPRRIDLVATGLPTGPHALEVDGLKIAGGLAADATAFDLIGPMSLAAEVVASGGLPLGPQDAGSEGVLVNATLGQPFAAPPVAFGDGSELRSGFVEVSEARIAGSAP